MVPNTRYCLIWHLGSYAIHWYILGISLICLRYIRYINRIYSYFVVYLGILKNVYFLSVYSMRRYTSQNGIYRNMSGYTYGIGIFYRIYSWYTWYTPIYSNTPTNIHMIHTDIKSDSISVPNRIVNGPTPGRECHGGYRYSHAAQVSFGFSKRILYTR